LLLEHLSEQLCASGSLQGEHLGRRGSAWANAYAEPAGLDFLAGNVGIPERENVPGIGRAHVRKT